MRLQLEQMEWLELKQQDTLWKRQKAKGQDRINSDRKHEISVD